MNELWAYKLENMDDLNKEEFEKRVRTESMSPLLKRKENLNF